MTLTLDLPPHLEAKFQAEAARRGIALPQYVLNVLESQATTEDATPEEEQAHPVLRLAEKARTLIPPEERGALPPDAAKNYKHYLYGSPKIEE